MSLAAVRASIRSNLKKRGTDVDLNDRDLMGDGDQSEIRPKGSNDPRQYYRNLFAEGADIHEIMCANALSPFGLLCVTGCYDKVKEELENAAKKDDEEENGRKKSDNAAAVWPGPGLKRLLETRETSMRLSPLLMMVSMSKNIAEPWMHKGQLEVVKILLRYGARPDARDVVGKTACHYGMGAMSTDVTLTAGGWCVDAHQSSHLVGREVELHGLKAANMNGRKGIARGYIVETGRRAILLSGEDKEVGIKPANLRLVDGLTTTPPSNLLDIQDRLGQVVLHELMMGNRTEVAEVVLGTYNARTDLEDWDDISPKSMALEPGAFIASRVAPLVNKASGKQGKTEEKLKKNQCGWCKKTDVHLFDCARCKLAQYCSKDCQVKDWKQGGHRSSCNAEDSADKAVVLVKPTMEDYSTAFCAKTMQVRTPKGFQKPSHVAVNQKFFIKVQCGPTEELALMIYDKTRECEFTYDKGMPGFKELFDSARAEKTWQGRKTFIKAAFDEKGNLKAWPNTRSVKNW